MHRLSWSISSDFGAVHSLNVRRSLKSRKVTKIRYFFVGSRSFKVVDVRNQESSSAVLVMMRSKSVSICNHSRARLVDISKNRVF